MHLLYSIMKTPSSPIEPTIAGLGGFPVFLASCNGLSAALSEHPPSPGSPDTKELLDYHRVVEDLHRRYDALPVRYGSCFHDPSPVQDFLRQRTRQYLALLDELAGKVEMGIRMLFPNDPGTDLKSVPGIDFKSVPEVGKGRDFLAARKTHYAQADQISIRYAQAAAYYGDLFSASSLRHTFDVDEKKLLLSLYFLVPKRQLSSFRETFRSIEKEKGEQIPNLSPKILLSGPWPPYNFAKLDLGALKAVGVTQ